MQHLDDLSQPALFLDPFKFDASAGFENDDVVFSEDKELAKCLTKRGILFSTTGLRHLNYSAASLKHFASFLTNDINAQEQKHGQLEPYSVELKQLATEMQHPSPLKITVKRVNENTQFVYVGVFFPWRATDILPCREYLNMSYLFVGGSHKLMFTMNDLFQKYFDCKIAPIVYTQNEIQWLLAIMIHCVDGPFSSDKLLFTYQMNFDSSKLDFTYSFSDLKAIWNDIHDKNENVIKHEEVLRLFAAIDEHVLEASGLNLSRYLLKRFSIPHLVTLDSEGKIDSHQLAAFDLVCRFIKERRSF